ncbi:MAG: extracellular solute-binding protein [Roseitalea sp.]|jgi:sn-glycerol 3-phosphate transport system substrate-binding protein|uniref:sn-glycerol-3-phosphate-binding periplasmic protein UgpB n=1 Tax=Oceaniradius stylonematis TaxID=2184161 RepID=A0A3A8ANH5_9HYPH|nr:extracellular solute-binding protein [Oceaniradius stylonematis]MBO6553903.1 extracellular solute-binding protein [Roseitalea sp.]MBO6952973.1 extracellular solute-binding protein [Rhizobiaceae bacterium]MBO6593320.1 extracellular solute-binding protein [Roseitalea sp.]MBO6600690.1 extracellular solute-binding protein [Roseitalea sp.]MBO6612371.1 extracellular solute-binding protein [Roseitalea sp.]
MMWKTLLAAGALALTTAAAQAEKIEIELWHAMGGALGEATNAVAEQFNASQDKYNLTPVYKGNYEETLTATIAAFRAGEQPNIVQVFDAGAATIIGAEGAVIPAQDLIENAGLEFRTDYIPGVANFYADENGKMVGMPFNSSTPILYYNVEALEKAGVEPPRTWEEFQEIAPALKEAGYVPMAQSHLPWIFTENFMSRHNLQFATNANGYEGAEGTRLLINVEPIKAHFAAVKEWIDAGLFGYYGTGWGDNQAPFENGEVAMWLGSSGSFGGLKQSAGFEFSATYLPYWEAVTEEPYNTFIGGAALFAMSGQPEEENEAAAAFFQFLSSPEPQVFWHKETGYVPITATAYELAKAEGHYDQEPAAEVGISQLQQPGGDWTKGYRMGFYVQIRDVMNREYGRIFSGEATVDEAFDIIEEEGNRLLERFAQTQSG